MTALDTVHFEDKGVIFAAGFITGALRIKYPWTQEFEEISLRDPANQPQSPVCEVRFSLDCKYLAVGVRDRRWRQQAQSGKQGLGAQ